MADTLDTSATEVYHYPGGELGATNPSLIVSGLDTKVQRGRAYWVRDSDYNRFFGTFSLTLQDSAGAHFGTALSAYRIRLSNTANETHTVTLEMVGSDPPGDGTSLVGVPPILVRGDLDPTTLLYPFTDLATTTLSWTLSPSGEVDSSVEIVLGIDRVAMASTPGDVYGAILRFIDDFAGSGYTEIDIPATAITGSMSGLWVGEAEITQVTQDLAEYEVDDEGATALNEDGSAKESSTEISFGGVARGYPLRLIMHMAEDGTTQLLQRVYYGLDENVIPILATGEDALNASHLDVARRITSVHLPWSEINTPWVFDDSLNFASRLTTTVTTEFNDQAANPFLHTYHPDHDNRSPLFEEYGEAERGFESYDIEREITLNSGTTLVSVEATTTSTSAETTTSEVVVIPSLPDGIQMVDLPQGNFIMGNDGAVGPLAPDHTPEREVYMSPFEMSEAEITVQQYVDYLNAAWEDGLITILEDSDGTFVVGATDQSYAGHKFIELSGGRVLKDHDGDGDIDPENPLNQCWIEFDGNKTFSVKDPAAIDWSENDLSEPLFASEWALEQDHIGSTVPTVVLNGSQDSDNDTFDLDGARSVAIDGNIAFVASEDSNKVLLINISDPSNPNHIRTISDSSSRKLAAPYHLNVHDGWLYVTSKDENAVTVFDISRLIARSGFLNTSFTYTVSESIRRTLNDGDESGRLGGPRFSTVYGDYLYIGGDEDRIAIFDISNMTADGPVFVRNDPVTAGGVEYGNFTWLEIVDGVGYLASNQQDAILVLDYASNPTGPGALSVLADGDGFFRLANCFHLLVNDNVLYASSRDEDAVTLIDVSDPSAPTLLKELRNGSDGYSLDRPLRMAILNDILFVPSNTSDSITMVDISDPTSPVLLETVKDGDSNYSRLNGAHSVVVEGEQIYVTAASGNALNIISPFPAGETLPNWPELTDDLPTQSEISTWPATFIKWHGAKSFAEYFGCDLPAEAQWEYAAKGGADLDFATSDGTVDATKANYNEDNHHPDTGHVEPVKSFLPNPFKLYDMSGNVWEWCRDWYDSSFYSSRPAPDYDPYNDALVVDLSGEPIEDVSFVGGPGQDYNGDARVKRGGSWNFHETSLNSAERERDYTWRGNDHFGFRIVRESFSIVPVEAVDFTSLSSSSTKLTGVYQERITLKGKDDESREYSIAGEFNLIRISDIDTLKTE